MNHLTAANPTTQSGFTLIELMFTLVVAAVLVSLAAPSFRDYMANQRIKNGAYDLIAAISFARSEAIKRNASVDVIPTDTANWAKGWTVSAGGTTLRAQDAKTGLSITASGGATQLTYSNDGRVTAATGFTIAPITSISGVDPRCVSIGPSGVPSSKLGGC